MVYAILSIHNTNKTDVTGNICQWNSRMKCTVVGMIQFYIYIVTTCWAIDGDLSGIVAAIDLLAWLWEYVRPGNRTKALKYEILIFILTALVFVKVVHFVLGNVDNILKIVSALAATRKNNYLFNRNCLRYVNRIMQARPIHSTKGWQKYTKTKQMMGHHPTDMLEIYMLTVMVLI